MCWTGLHSLTLNLLTLNKYFLDNSSVTKIGSYADSIDLWTLYLWIFGVDWLAQ